MPAKAEPSLRLCVVKLEYFAVPRRLKLAFFALGYHPGLPLLRASP